MSIEEAYMRELEEYYRQEAEEERLYEEFLYSLGEYDFQKVEDRLNEIAGVECGMEGKIEAYINDVTKDVSSDELRYIDEYVLEYLCGEEVVDEILKLKYPGGVDDDYYDSEEYDGILDELNALTYDIPLDELKIANDREYQEELHHEARLERELFDL